MWEKWSRLLGKEGPVHKKLCLILLAAGLLLLCFAEVLPDRTQTEEAKVPLVSQDRESALESRLEQVLSQVAGAGRVEVMVTLNSSKEQVVAQEKAETASRDAEGGAESGLETRYVLLEKADGSTSPLVLKEEEAKVEGVLIVAEGADNVLVTDSLSRAAQALLAVPAHKVEVLKMK